MYNYLWLLLCSILVRLVLSRVKKSSILNLNLTRLSSGKSPIGITNTWRRCLFSPYRDFWEKLKTQLCWRASWEFLVFNELLKQSERFVQRFKSGPSEQLLFLLGRASSSHERLKHRWARQNMFIFWARSSNLNIVILWTRSGGVGRSLLFPALSESRRPLCIVC